MSNVNPSVETEKRSPNVGVGAKVELTEVTPNLEKLLRRRSALRWTHKEGEFGGTTYYYKSKGKYFAKFIPNWANDTISYGEVSAKEALDQCKT